MIRSQTKSGMTGRRDIKWWKTYSKIWHEIVAEQRHHQSALHHSPRRCLPLPLCVSNLTRVKTRLCLSLTQVIEIFEDFTYHREMFSNDGQHAFLEFTTKIGDKTLKGIDMISFDEHGLITEFEVMIRPMSGLMALAEHMAPRMVKLKV